MLNSCNSTDWINLWQKVSQVVKKKKTVKGTFTYQWPHAPCRRGKGPPAWRPSPRVSLWVGLSPRPPEGIPWAAVPWAPSNQTHHKEPDGDIGKANGAPTTTNASMATNSRLLSCRHSSAPPSSWPTCLPDPSPSSSDQKSSLSSVPRWSQSRLNLQKTMSQLDDNERDGGSFTPQTTNRRSGSSFWPAYRLISGCRCWPWWAGPASRC